MDLMETESSTVASEASSVIVEMEEDLIETSSMEKVELEEEKPLETPRRSTRQNGHDRSQDVSASETATPVVPIEYPGEDKMEEFVILKLDIPPLPPLLSNYHGDDSDSGKDEKKTLKRTLKMSDPRAYIGL